MTEKTKLLPEGKFVQFTEPGDGFTAGLASIKGPITIYSPHSFECYREEARKVIRVLKGEGVDDEHLDLPEFGYNALGLNSFLAALAFEILDEESHL